MPQPLDDPTFVTRNDPKGMLALTAAFPEQCRKAREIADSFELPNLDFEPSLVLLTGLGGSAAGGDFVRALFEAFGEAPFAVNRDYTLPHFAGPETLLFVVSYSGNTEETLSAYADAKKRGCSMIAITSGGRLAELARADGVPVIAVPGGQPPRTALGYLLVPVIVTCDRLGLLPDQMYEQAFSRLDLCAKEWGIDRPFAENAAKQLAQSMKGSLIVLYGLGTWQGIVAGRWKAQINENAKVHAFVHSFPELNHNEILGWVATKLQSVPKWEVVVLQDGTESPKLRARAKISAELIGAQAEFRDAFAEGVGLFERMLSLTFLGDWVSLYLAALNEVDPENIDWLNHLKGELAKID